MYGNNARTKHCKKLLKAPVKRDRNRTPPKCRLCIYYQPQFRYRTCLFSICPYGKSRNTAFRKKPLSEEKIIGRKGREMDA